MRLDFDQYNLKAPGEHKVFMPGLSVRKNKNGFVAVDLGYQADPVVFTPELIAEEKLSMPGWRWNKEYERDWDAQNGQPVFDQAWLSRQEARARNPVYRMDLIPVLDERGEPIRDDRGGTTHTLAVKKNGRLKVFLPPSTQPATLPDGAERVKRACAIGMDVGEGVGGSDSTINVFFADNREQAAEFACNKIRPGELGRFAVAVARYYNNALIVCVRKMHGITTLRAIADSGYPLIWRHTDPNKIVEKKTQNLGWARGESSDDRLFGGWIDAMQEDLVILHGATTIAQHKSYIYDELGRAVHQRLISQPKEVRERHGDLVIGAALAYVGCKDLPKYRELRKTVAPETSFQARKNEQIRKKLEASQW